jgi:ABC-2 type transport system ATP-binding protein
VILKTEGLTKRFGSFTAVDGLTLEVGGGEIVGLLGPNGAGKTTTMRMLTCFLPATSGTASVAGCDIARDPLGVRRSVGYMAESNPLYGELRVREHLGYRARLKGVARGERERRIGEAMALCGVADVAGQVIRTLSKGYRQRVGLADALLGRPKLLILDEPTIGLDPNQIRQTRAMIRSLGERHTILLSTHILPEVEAVCGRVLIIKGGRIVADDSPERLSAALRAGAVEAEIAGAPSGEVSAALRALPGVGTVVVACEEGGWTRATVDPAERGGDIREAIYECVRARGWRLRELAGRRASLEEVFHEITLREGTP